MSVIELKTKAEFDQLIEKTPYVALQATAGWCGPCKAISPLFKKHAAALTKPEYVFAKFDIDDLPDLSQELGISSIPAFYFFENGNKDSDFKGANPPVLQKTVESYSQKAAAAGGAPAAAEGAALKTDENF